MSQTELERAVARATGESARRVRKIGFVLVRPQAREPRKPRRPTR